MRVRASTLVAATALVWIAAFGTASGTLAKAHAAAGRILITQEALYDCGLGPCFPGGYWSMWAGKPGDRLAKLGWLGNGETWNFPMQPAVSAVGSAIVSFEFGRGVVVTKLDRVLRWGLGETTVPLGLPVDLWVPGQPESGAPPLGAALSPSGERLALLAKIGSCGGPRFSPDGRRVAFISDLSGRDRFVAIAQHHCPGKCFYTLDL